MKSLKFLLPICLLVLLGACKVSEEPTFEKMKNIKVLSLKLDDVQITCDAFFQNPNDVGVELIETDLDIIVNKVNTGKIAQTSNTVIKANNQFSIPLKISFNPKDVFKNEKGGLLGSVVSSFTDKKINLVYKGKVKLKKAGISFDVPVDYTTDVDLKKNKTE